MSKGRELFYLDEDGNRSDAGLHDDMLEAVDSDPEYIEASIQRQIMGGMDEANARRFYGK